MQNRILFIFSNNSLYIVFKIGKGKFITLFRLFSSEMTFQSFACDWTLLKSHNWGAQEPYLPKRSSLFPSLHPKKIFFLIWLKGSVLPFSNFIYHPPIILVFFDPALIGLENRQACEKFLESLLRLRVWFGAFAISCEVIGLW